jgi:hypothetical protein
LILTPDGEVDPDI